MRPADTWQDYELLDATNHNRLERWGSTLLSVCRTASLGW